jgi:hypothetical protein
VLGWTALAGEDYVAAQEWLAQSIAVHREVEYQFAREWLAATLPAAARAAMGLGHRAEAQTYLAEALEIALEIGAYIPMLFLMPIIPVVLADDEDEGLKERAVELYAMAESRPFVANSRLFEDIAGRHIRSATADVSPEVVEAAQARGRALDWWETAAKLLDELPELGWTD